MGTGRPQGPEHGLVLKELAVQGEKPQKEGCLTTGSDADYTVLQTLAVFRFNTKAER